MGKKKAGKSAAKQHDAPRAPAQVRAPVREKDAVAHVSAQPKHSEQVRQHAVTHRMEREMAHLHAAPQHNPARSVLAKLLLFTIAMIVLPMSTLFYAQTIFTDSYYAPVAAAVVVVHVIIAAYAVMAYYEQSSEKR